MTLVGEWSGPVRVVVMGCLAYVVLVAVLRVSGKRTLAAMNAFDLVVTVALGSTLATVLLSSDVALAEGIVALVLLAALQALAARLSIRSPRVRRMVRSEPRLLVRGGRLLADAMREERVLEQEVLQALRAHGVADLADAEAVVLETDGRFSVLTARAAEGGDSTLSDVRRPDDPAGGGGRRG